MKGISFPLVWNHENIKAYLSSVVLMIHLFGTRHYFLSIEIYTHQEF